VSLKRGVAYVHQQDVHLATSTVREALLFSAMLRQAVEVQKGKRLACVEDTIGRLSIEDFTEVVVGVPGRGLKLKQRKRLSISVELFFRDIGQDLETVLGYSRRYRSRRYPDAENSAKYPLDVIGDTDATTPDSLRL
jgi:hypothetical protein